MAPKIVTTPTVEVEWSDVNLNGIILLLSHYWQVIELDVVNNFSSPWNHQDKSNYKLKHKKVFL